MHANPGIFKGFAHRSSTPKPTRGPKVALDPTAEASRSPCTLCVHTTPLFASVPYFSFQNVVTLVLLVHCKYTLVQSIWHVHCFSIWFVAALLSSKLRAFVNNIMPCKVTDKAGYCTWRNPLSDNFVQVWVCSWVWISCHMKWCNTRHKNCDRCYINIIIKIWHW